MLIGSHFGGLAIENSMLGATHACATPLTTHYDLPHGVAIALMLAHVVEWNGAVAGRQYDELYSPAIWRGRLARSGRRGGSAGDSA